MLTDFEQLEEKWPFMSVCKESKKKDLYIGIILNQTKNFTSIYIIDNLHTDNEKKRFLELGEIWWYESNRKLPISIFLRNEFDQFRYTLKNFQTKDIEVLIGPITKLSNIVSKRIKRTTINLNSKNLNKKKGVK